MRVVQRAGVEASLPDVPTGLVRGIPVRGITSVSVLQRQGQRLGTARNNDQVHVVGHEAVAEKTQFVEVHVAPQQFEIHLPFAVRRQQELPRVSALRHMMRNIYDSDKGKPRHHLARISENVPSVPRFPIRISPVRYNRGHRDRNVKQRTQKRDSALHSIGRSGGHSNVLFLIAIKTLRSMRLKPKSPQSDTDAMICTVFAVAAIETFIYELGEEALRTEDKSPHASVLQGLGKLVRDKERFPLFQKAIWIVRYLTGKRPDQSDGVFRDFDVLVRLRNTIIHLKDPEETLHYQDGQIENTGTPKVISQLESMGLIPRPYRPSWIVAISTLEIAEWSCRTARTLAETLMNILPASWCKQMMNCSLRGFELYEQP